MYRVKAKLRRYHTLYKQIAYIHFTLDSTGVVLSVDQFGAARLGYASKKLVKKTVFSILHWEDQETLQAALTTFWQSHINGQSLQVTPWEFRLVCQDASILWVKGVAQTVPLETLGTEANTDEALGISLVCEDITERKQTEEALRESEELHRVTLSNISDAVFITDATGAFTFICPNVHIIFGYSQPEVQQLRNISQLLGDHLFSLQELAVRGEIQNIEREITDKAGQTHTLLVNVKRVAIQGGTVLYSCHDITERKCTEEALRESERQLRVIFNSSLDAMVIADDHGKLVEVNPAACTLLNLPKERLIGCQIADLAKPCEQVANPFLYFSQAWKNLQENRQKTGKFLLQRPDGTVRTVEYSVSTNFFPLRHLVVWRDITETQLAEAELQQYRYHLEELVEERTAEVIWVNEQLQQAQLMEFQSVGWDISERKRAEEQLTKINECFLSFGTDSLENIKRLTALAGELLGATCAFYNRLDQGKLCAVGQWHTPADYDPVDRAEGDICWQMIQRGSSEPFIVCALPNTFDPQTDPNITPAQLKTYVGQAVRCNDAYIGSLCVVYQKDYLPSSADQRLLGIIASAIGVEEERRRAGEALRASEERFRSLSACSPVGIFVADVEGRCTYTNPHFQEIGGLTLEQSLGEGWTKFIYPEDKDQVFHQWSICAREGQRCLNEYRFQTPDGRVRWVQGRTSPMLSDQGELMGHVGTLEDITERKQAEEELNLRNQELLTLHRISEIALNTKFLQAAFQEIVEEISSVTGFPIVAIELYDDARQMMVFVGMKGISLPPGQRGLEVSVEETLSGTVAKTGQPIVKTYVVQESKPCDSNKNLHQLGIKTFICMPMRAHQSVIGVLSLAHPEVVPFNDYFLRWIASLANYMASLTERKQSEEALRQQAERERLLGAITMRIRQSLDLEEILNTTVTEVRQFLQAERTIIYRFEPDWSGVVAVESVESGWSAILGTVIYDPCFAETYVWQYQEGRVRTIENIYTAGLGECHVNLLAQFQVQASLTVPILQGEQLWGLLIAYQCSATRRWQQSEIELLKQLATQVGIAIQQSQLYQQLKDANQVLQQLATLDGLTQVANRRSFDEYLAREWRRSARDQASLSLILCDIDFFKLYNDTYGHQVGDDCLRQVANAIRQAVKRPADLVARYGGEEFVVILPDTEAKGAVRVAEQIRSLIKTLQIAHGASPVNQCVTLSLGVATLLPSCEVSQTTLISSADQALYQAKKQGRDRVVLQA